jgi:hypothetical protein
MSRITRILLSLCTVLLAAALVTTASASPEAVLADYADDGVVQGRYGAEDLSAALRLARSAEQRQYAAAADAIQAAQAESLFGGRPDETPRAPAPASAPAKDDAATGDASGDGDATSQELVRPAPAAITLPSPPTVEPDAGVPWPFVALSVGALLLVVGGTASAVHRRIARRR